MARWPLTLDGPKEEQADKLRSSSFQVFGTAGKTGTQEVVRVPRVVVVDVHTVSIGIAHVHEVTVRRALCFSIQFRHSKRTSSQIKEVVRVIICGHSVNQFHLSKESYKQCMWRRLFVNSLSLAKFIILKKVKSRHLTSKWRDGL